MRITVFGTLAACLGLAACATSPIPKKMKQELAPGVTFKAVLSRPEAHIGQRVLWAGEILDLRNTSEGSFLEVLQSPTDSSDAPTDPENSQGRFIAFTRQYLDRAVYKSGRKVTVFGEVRGKKDQPLGEGQMNYSYPLLEIQRLHLWPKPSRRDRFPPYYDSAYPYDPWGYPGAHPWDPRFQDYYWDPVWRRWMPRW